MENKDKWCFAWFAQPPAGSGKSRAAMVKGAKWSPGDTITVSFLDGDAATQDRVREAALAWVGPKMADLSLEFRKDTTNTLVRISFQYQGSWSVIGTTCRQVKKTQPTMNFGWLDKNSSDKEVRRVVLHEFGHALGLIHEHQNPGGKIKWNRAQVIKDLSGPPNNWSLGVIETNMFRPYSRHETNYTALDPKSIMMYPLPAKWTLDGFSVGMNTALSPTDKKFIKAQYR